MNLTPPENERLSRLLVPVRFFLMKTSKGSSVKAKKARSAGLKVKAAWTTSLAIAGSKNAQKALVADEPVF